MTARLFEKFGPNHPGHLPPPSGGKKPLLGPTLNFDRTSQQQILISTSGKELVTLQGLPYALKLGELWSRSG